MGEQCWRRAGPKRCVGGGGDAVSIWLSEGAVKVQSIRGYEMRDGQRKKKLKLKLEEEVKDERMN